MKRKLLKQMLTEWRSNIWLVIELLIVVLLLQIICSCLYYLYSLYEHDNGYDLNDVYIASLDRLDKECEDYSPYDSVHSPITDIDLLLTNMRANPYVEIVATGNWNSVPYQYSYSGASIELLGNKDAQYNGNMRQGSPEMMQVFRIKGVNGETPEELAEILEHNDIIISPYDNPTEQIPDFGIFAGKDVVNSRDSLQQYHVGAIAYGLRRNDFEPLSQRGVIYKKAKRSDVSYLLIRVKPNMGNKFTESLTALDMQAGNLFIYSLESAENMRDSAQLEFYQIIRNFAISAIFIMMVIFLGFLGSFWFRTQQRSGEIAIRKVNGATNFDIYKRFFAEGLILLSVPFIFTIPLTYWIITNGFLDEIGLPVSANIPVIAGLIMTIVILAVLIIAGIYAPAHKATRIDPAITLKEL